MQNPLSVSIASLQNFEISNGKFPIQTNNICLPLCYKKSINIATSDIIHLEGHSNYTLFYFVNGKLSPQIVYHFVRLEYHHF